MLKLLKFEFNRKRLVLLIAAAATLIGEAVVLGKYYSIDASLRNYAGTEYFIILLSVLLVGFLILYLIDMISLMRQDMFKQEGYMLFMTPNSGYKILGSKLLFAFLEGLALMAVYVAILMINFKVIGGDFQLRFPNWGEINPDEILLIIKVLFLIVLSIIEFALSIYFSFAIFKGLFSNNRFKGLITFGIFIGVSLIRSKIGDLMAQAFLDDTTLEFFQSASGLTPSVNFGIVESLVWILIFFFATGYMLEHKVNL